MEDHSLKMQNDAYKPMNDSREIFFLISLFLFVEINNKTISIRSK